jgi:hypothetical protein
MERLVKPAVTRRIYKAELAQLAGFVRTMPASSPGL